MEAQTTSTAQTPLLRAPVDEAEREAIRAHAEDEWCGDLKGVWACSRPPNHTGKHVFGGGELVIGVWEQS